MRLYAVAATATRPTDQEGMRDEVCILADAFLAISAEEALDKMWSSFQDVFPDTGGWERYVSAVTEVDSDTLREAFKPLSV